MRTYLATLVFEIRNDSPNGAQFDIQHHLIQAIDETDALHQAEQLGVAEDEIFSHVSGAVVHWAFCGIRACTELRDTTSDLVGQSTEIVSLAEKEQYLNQLLTL